MTEVQHQPEAGRFVTERDGFEAEVAYEIEGGQMLLTHTRVPPAIEGRGVAGELVRAAFEHARASGMRVRPLCSYAAAWSKRHSEYADLLG